MQLSGKHDFKLTETWENGAKRDHYNVVKGHVRTCQPRFNCRLHICDG